MPAGHRVPALTTCEIMQPYYLQNKITDITSVAKVYPARGAGALWQSIVATEQPPAGYKCGEEEAKSSTFTMIKYFDHHITNCLDSLLQLSQKSTD